MQGLIQLCRKIQNILYCTVLGWAVLGCDLRAGGLPQTICKGESAIVGTDIGADCDLSMGVTWEYKDETMEDYLIFSTTAEAQTVSPTLSTTYRLTKFCDSGGVITSCQETYIVNVVSITVHPIDTDFATDKEGVIIISTLMPDDHEFYTVTNTAMDGSAAQINAGEVRITAHITPVSLAHNVEVTFKLIDPIDLSPYTFELEDGNEPIYFFQNAEMRITNLR